MAIRELTSAEIEGLVGMRHAVAGFEYPTNGLQPYYRWLVSSLHLLGEASAGGLRVDRDDSDETTVRIAPGRATLDGVVLEYAGGTLDVGPFNNGAGYVWVYDGGSGVAVVGAGSGAAGWPSYPHIKLAEVALSAGVIVQVLDRRGEAILNQGPDSRVVAGLVTYQMAITAQGGTSTPTAVTIAMRDFRGNPVAVTDYLRVRVCNNGGYTNATNASITAGSNTTVVETIVAGKDLVLKSHTDGVFVVSLTDGAAETVTLRIGPPTFSARRADYSPTLNISHS
jgi:hypothetical protein